MDFRKKFSQRKKKTDFSTTVLVHKNLRTKKQWQGFLMEDRGAAHLTDRKHDEVGTF